MTKKEEKLWKKERNLMEKIFLGISGLKVRVKNTDSEDIGYTDGNDIYLSYKNELTEKLSSTEASALRLGVGFHELLHKMLTDFKILNSTMNAMPKYEGMIFHQIDNALEDAAIENFADEVAGGYVLDSLRFAIAKTYELSPNLEDVEGELNQFFLALIHFGDMGLLKGHFTNEETKKIFLECAPIFYAGLNSKNPKYRNECSKKIFNISKPLWEDLVKDNEKMEKMLKEFLDMLEEMGVLDNLKSSSGSGSGVTIEIDASATESENKETKANKRRKEAIKKLEKEISSKETDKNQIKDNESEASNSQDDEMSDNPEDSDSKSANSKNDKPDSKKNNSKSSNDQECESGDELSDENNDDLKENCGEKNEEESESESSDELAKNYNNKEEESQKTNDNNDNSETNSGNRISDKSTNVIYSDSECDRSIEEDKSNELSEEDFELNDDALNAIEEAIKNTPYEIAEVKSESFHGDFDIKIDSPKCKNASCLNKNMAANKSNFDTQHDLYNSVLSALNPTIKILTNKIKKIIQYDVEEVIYKNSGKPNMKRYYGSKITSRVFDRLREPGNKNDTSVFVLLDESGSMGGNKIKAARETIIVLAEVFNNLKIPFYAMGFTANEKGYDANHNHYIKWKNSLIERVSLLSINARSNNFDGYSIRYAGEIMKKKKSTNKILIVISDGQPCASCYYGSSAISDTKNAVSEVKKYMNVLGVAIGNDDTELLHNMYGNDFIHISNVNELKTKLPNKIAKMIES